MSYIDGYIAAEPAASRDAFVRHAAEAAALFTAHGALRVAENWGDDVPAGKLTDMMMAVRANADEVVCRSWIEWPSKAVRDQAWADLMNDPRMQAMGSTMPFDGKRMIFGGFETVVDHRG